MDLQNRGFPRAGDVEVNSAPELASSITIVIPCYNEAERLPKFLDSLCEHFKKYTRLEFIVVDDGSKESESKFLERCVQKVSLVAHIPVKYCRLPSNRGKGAAVKKGFSLASGTIVGFVDADGSVSAPECEAVLGVLIRDQTDPSLIGTIGSRIKMLGKNITRNTYRHSRGRVYRYHRRRG